MEKEIMDIKDGSAIREIMLERFKAKSKENPVETRENHEPVRNIT